MYSKTIILICLLLSQITIASTFGSSGSDGANGSDATDGFSPETVKVYLDGYEISHDLRGGDAQDNATNGSAGSDASSCYQPTDDYDVTGADGGDGGAGGEGGAGGNGGDTIIFYKDIKNLSLVHILNSPGTGTPGAYGSTGGSACSCSTSSWTNEYCYMDEECHTENQCHTEQDCRSVPSCHTRQRCTTDSRGGKRCESYEVCDSTTECSDVTVCNDVSVCEDVQRCEDRSYSCSDGSNGSSGSDGSHGSIGSRGEIILVKDLSEIPSVESSKNILVKDLEQSDVELSKNVWEVKTGASGLLASGSDISDQYKEFVKTDTNTIELEWSADKSIEEFLDIKFSLNFQSSGEANIEMASNHLIKKSIERKGSHSKIIIEQAYKVSDVNQLESSFQGRKKDFEIVITDKASLSHILENEVRLKLELNQLIGSKTLFSGVVPTEQMIVSPDKIIIKAGELASENKRLKKGRKIKYKMSITRTYEKNKVEVNLSKGKTKIK